MIFKEIFSFFSYEFVRNAFFVGLLISLSFSFLSPFLVLKNCSLLGHSLSDVGLATFALASLVNISPVFLSIPFMVLISFFVFYFGNRNKSDGSSLLAIFSTAAVAFGIIVTSFNKGFNSNFYSYIFGSVFSVQKGDLAWSLILTTFVILSFFIFYNKFFIIMFDETFAKSRGFNVLFYKFFISVLISITAVLGIKMVGSLLISSFMIFPAIISKKVAKSFKQLLFYCAIFSTVSFIFGFFLSLVFNVPTGAGIVLISVFLLVFSKLFALKFSN